MITPMEIKKYKFSKSLFGYDRIEVEQLLEKISEYNSQLMMEKNMLSERIESLKTDLGKYKDIEKNLEGTLLLTKEMVDNIKDNAQKEKNIILSNARLEANDVKAQALREKQELDVSIQNLKNIKNQLLIEIEGVIESYKRLTETFNDEAAVTELEKISGNE